MFSLTAKTWGKSWGGALWTRRKFTSVKNSQECVTLESRETQEHLRGLAPLLCRGHPRGVEPQTDGY